jgi:hypothetical protein
MEKFAKSNKEKQFAKSNKEKHLLFGITLNIDFSFFAILSSI